MARQPMKVEFDLSELISLSDGFPGVVAKMLMGVAIALQAEMVKEAPVDKGILRGSIGFPVQLGGLAIEIPVGADYWTHVQFGTEPHRIEPKTKKALRFESKGNVIFAKFVDHPGTAANPFVDRAVDNVEPRVSDILERFIEEAI